MSNGIVISLCDYTGNMVKPWIENGYQAFLVDPQHGTTRTEHGVTKFAGTIEEALPELSEIIRSRDVSMVFGFPPCTNLAVSGARHFDRKMTDKAWEHYQGPNAPTSDQQPQWDLLVPFGRKTSDRNSYQPQVAELKPASSSNGRG